LVNGFFIRLIHPNKLIFEKLSDAAFLDGWLQLISKRQFYPLIFFFSPLLPFSPSHLQAAAMDNTQEHTSKLSN